MLKSYEVPPMAVIWRLNMTLGPLYCFIVILRADGVRRRVH